MYFRYLCNYLPLAKGGGLHLNKLESPSPKDALCQVWLKLAQWFWRRRWKCEKFTTSTTTTTTTTDNGQILIRKAHLSLRLRWAKNWKIIDDSDQVIFRYSFKFILDYRKMGKFLLQCILFLQKFILNRATRPFHRKCDEFRILLCLRVFSAGDLEFVLDAFCTNELD